MDVKANLKQAAMTILGAGILYAGSVNAQTNGYTLTKDSVDNKLEGIIEKKAEHNKLDDMKKDSLTDYWLPLYINKGGVRKDVPEKTEDRDRDTITIKRSGASGPYGTIISIDSITSRTKSAKSTIRTYDLGSFSTWARDYNIPSYAKECLFTGLNEYFHNNPTGNKEKKGKREKPGENENTADTNRTKTSYTTLLKNFNKTGEIERKGTEKNKKNENKSYDWRLSVKKAIGKNYENGLQLSLSRQIYQSDSRPVSFHLDGNIMLNTKMTEEYTSSNIEKQGWTLPETEYDGNNNGYKVKRNTTSGQHKEEHKGGLSLGIRFGNPDNTTFTAYVGGNITSTEWNGRKARDIIDVYETQAKNKRISFEKHPERSLPDKETEYEMNPTIGCSIDHEIVGVSATYHITDDKKNIMMIGGNINF